MAQIAEIIKYEGDNSTFIWKHPCEDFNSMTQLIVHESQEAIFFMNGQALDSFGAGRHTLKTQHKVEQMNISKEKFQLSQALVIPLIVAVICVLSFIFR
jgi:membrane protease subunit (stomatin/prohibitin family)